jgi:hypothetical protein
MKKKVSNFSLLISKLFSLKGIDKTRDIDITKSFICEDSTYIRKSKKTLLIFRRMSDRKAKCNLELRHQRTCDVCFDWG